jgi:hypothetical protein
VLCPEGTCSFNDGTLLNTISGITTYAHFYLSTGPESKSFHADFEDGALDPDWTYLPWSASPLQAANWSEANGYLAGTSLQEKITALAAPAFAGCRKCAFEVSLQTAGGKPGVTSILAWYRDSRNMLELTMNEHEDLWILTHHVMGRARQRIRKTRQIQPNTTYIVRLVYDGVRVQVFVSDHNAPLIEFAPRSFEAGTFGVQATNTAVAIDSVHIAW